MKLMELNPKWDSENKEHHYLTFDCPSQHENDTGKCIITLPVKIGGRGWSVSDDSFENMTITPSVFHHCSKNPHFFITKGEILMC